MKPMMETHINAHKAARAIAKNASNNNYVSKGREREKLGVSPVALERTKCLYISCSI